MSIEQLTSLDLPQQTTASGALSIVVPTLNEAENMPELLRRIDETLVAAAILYEVIVVDDHSTDGTIAVAEQLAATHGWPVRTALKQGRRGKAFSLIEGFALARFELLAMIDADLQYPPEAFPKLVAALETADIVVGDRRNTYDNPSRVRGALSKTFATIVNRGIFGTDIDLQSGLKVFTRASYEQVRLDPGPWSFDVDFVAQAMHQGTTAINVPIIYGTRERGDDKVMPLAVGTELLLTSLRVKAKLLSRGVDQMAELPAVIEEEQPGFSGECEMVAARYRAWLKAEPWLRTKDPENYQEQANATITHGKRHVRTFAPFNAAHSAIHTTTVGQRIVLGLMVAMFVASVVLWTIPTLVSALAVITSIYLVDLAVQAVMATNTLQGHTGDQIDDAVVHALADANWPNYTILCPLYHEAAVVPQFVRAIEAMDYPSDRLQVLLLTEEDDTETRAAIALLGLPEHFEVVTVPDGSPRTKPRACNYGLLQATGDFIVIYDAEDVPEPLQLKKAVLTFANHDDGIACVQAKLNFYNAEQNILTRWFTVEYSLWFDLILPGLQHANVPLPLGGTSNHFRTSLLRTVGGWDPYNVTEDCDLGLRLAEHQLSTAMLDSTTYEEANSRAGNWMRQRSRWIKGYMQTYFVHMRRPGRYLREGRIREFFALQLFVGGKALTLLVNPLMWGMLGIYLAFRVAVEPFFHQVFPGPLLYMGAICLIAGNFFYLYAYLVGCEQRQHFGLTKWAMLTPVYWLMMSGAALIALKQLIFQPHYWEKTQHGLHLAWAQPSEDELVLSASARTTASAE